VADQSGGSADFCRDYRGAADGARGAAVRGALMIEVRDIADRLNGCALDLCRQYLPGGARQGDKWFASNIWDSGKGASLVVTLSGDHIGKWRDFGGAAAGEAEGDMIDLIAIRLCGGDKRAAIQEAKRRLGIEDAFIPGRRAEIDPAEVARQQAAARERARARQAEEAAQRKAKIERAKGLWLSGRPIAGTPAEAYLRGRGFDTRGCAQDKNGGWPGSFRFHSEVWHRQSRVKIPALLAAAFTPDGEHVATQRIFLQRCIERGWTKIDSDHAKMVLGPIGGAFIPINKGASGKSMRDMPAGEQILMAEGNEKCMALRMLKPEMRIVCGYSLDNMGAIVFPETTGALIIAADRPKSEDELHSFEKVIARQQARGLSVRHFFPPAPYKDIDEWLVAVLAESDTSAQRRAG
jgi:Toprim domain